MEGQLEIELLEQLASVIPFELLAALEDTETRNDTETHKDYQIIPQITIVRAANLYIQLLLGVVHEQTN